MRIDYVLGQGFDSNVFLVGEDVSLLIDSGTGLNFDWLKKKLEEYKFNVEDLDILVDTHCHFDHTGGNGLFLEESGCDLMASEEAAKALEGADGNVTLADDFGGHMAPLEISRVLGEGDKIELGDEDLVVWETPGHTRGSICLYSPDEKVLFSGDTVFKGGIGRMDFPSSSSEAMKESLERLSNVEVKGLYPGHGPVAKEEGSKYIDMALDLFF